VAQAARAAEDEGLVMRTKQVFHVYTLSDPLTPHLIRYIGMTGITLEERLRQHLRFSTSLKPNHKECWIRSLINQGRNPIISSLETCDTREEALDGECWWIEAALKEGWQLTNGSSGGEGAIPSEATKRRMSEAAKRRWEDSIEREKEAERGRLRLQNPLLRQLLSEKARERWQDPVFHAEQAEGNRQRAQTPEHRKKQSQDTIEQWQDPVYRKKLTEINRARVQSQEFRKRQGDALRSLWQDPIYREKQLRSDKGAAISRAAQDPEKLEQRAERTRSLWQDPTYRQKTNEARNKAKAAKREAAL